MNKLERLLYKTHIKNYPDMGTIEDFRAQLYELGNWVYSIWMRGNLGPNAFEAQKHMRSIRMSADNYVKKVERFIQKVKTEVESK